MSFRHRPWWRRAAPAGAMFKNTFQSGFLSVLYSIGSKPLQIWDKKVRGGAGRSGQNITGRAARAERCGQRPVCGPLRGGQRGVVLNVGWPRAELRLRSVISWVRSGIPRSATPR